MTEKKRIVVNAFDMTATSHQSFGLWLDPRSRADEYNTIKYWTDLAKVCEKGLFDAVFIAEPNPSQKMRSCTSSSLTSQPSLNCQTSYPILTKKKTSSIPLP